MQKIAWIFFALHVSLTSCRPKWDLVKIGEIHFVGRSEGINRVIKVTSKGAVNGLSIAFDNPVDINDITGDMRVFNPKNGYDKSFVFVPRAGNWTGRKNEFVLVTGAEIPPGEQVFHLNFSSSIDLNKGHVYVTEIFK
jgi:hypothetical protein